MINPVGNVTYATLPLSEQDHREYYNGFANQTLWPLFHYRMDLTRLDRASWKGYQRVNALLAEKLRPLLKSDEAILEDVGSDPLADRSAIQEEEDSSFDDDDDMPF